MGGIGAKKQHGEADEAGQVLALPAGVRAAV